MKDVQQEIKIKEEKIFSSLKYETVIDNTEDFFTLISEHFNKVDKSGEEDTTRKKMHLYNKNIKIKETLIDHPEFIIANDSKTRSPLHFAVELFGEGTNLTTIEILNFENLLNIPAINHEGKNALHSSFKKVQCFEILNCIINTTKSIKNKKMEVEFDLCFQSSLGKNAFHYFAEDLQPFTWYRHDPKHTMLIYNFLVEKGGTVGQKLKALRMVDKNGNSPIHSILSNKDFCKICPTEIVKEFTSNMHKDGILLNYMGYSALHCFVANHSPNDNHNWNFSFLEPLISSDILKIQCSKGNTIIHLATEKGFISFIKYLMDNGAIKPEEWLDALEIQNYVGQCAIHLAASLHNEILIKYCSSDTSIRIRDHKGELPLHYFFKKKPSDNIFDVRGCVGMLIGDKNWRLMEKINFDIGSTPLHRLFEEISPDENVPYYLEDLLTEENLSVFDFKGVSPVHVCKNLKLFKLTSKILADPLLDCSGKSYLDYYEVWEKEGKAKVVPQKLRKHYFNNLKKGNEVFDDFILKNIKNVEKTEEVPDVDSEDDLSSSEN